MTVDFSNWVVASYNDDTGFGRMAADVRSTLGVGYQVVFPSERLWTKPLNPDQDSLIDPADPREKIEQALRGRQGLLFFERPNWHPLLLQTAKDLGLFTVCVPMWEWFRGDDPPWRLCDLFVAPSKMSLSVVRSFGHKNSTMLPWTLDLSRFPKRSVKGPARLFVHNAGLVDLDDRKGTRDTILAFKKVKVDSVRLLVRLQKEVELPELDDKIEVRIGNLDEPADLYSQGDVAIQPSKMEGLGFMVLEPVCSGMPVITLDYGPMNEIVRQKEMLVRKRWFKRKAYPGNWLKHSHLRLADGDDLTRKIEWCAVNDLSEISRTNRQWAESTFDVNHLREQWTRAIDSLMSGQLPNFVRTRDDELRKQ